MDYEFVKVDREGPITVVTINRPEVMNALHPMANEELSQVFDAFDADPEQWVAIITGAGGERPSPPATTFATPPNTAASCGSSRKASAA